MLKNIDLYIFLKMSNIRKKTPKIPIVTARLANKLKHLTCKMKYHIMAEELLKERIKITAV